MSKALDNALRAAKVVKLDFDKIRYVIMSDQHIGDGKKGSDDFRLNSKTYEKALTSYYNRGFTLISVGDNEELWECDFPDIHRKYPKIYDLEAKFAKKDKLYRVYGNHDIFWRNETFFNNHLKDILPGIKILESLLLKGKDGDIFLTHGHQGEILSDVLWPVGRFFVRNVWKPAQCLIGIKNTGAARNIKKRNLKELMFYQWAKTKGLLFIAGHTHRAMFGSLSKIDRLRMELDDLIAKAFKFNKTTKTYKNIMKDINKKKNELQVRRKKEFGDNTVPTFEEKGIFSPCYFNDGCCCYTDGITAIELDKGLIRLVKWDRKDKPNDPEVYEKDELKKLFLNITLAKP